MKQLLARPFLRVLLLALLVPPAFSATATAAPPPPMFASGRPVFDPVKFFTGHTRSWGVFENGRGEPTAVITTETRGRVVGGELRMEQDLWIGSKPRQHRSWKVRRLAGWTRLSIAGGFAKRQRLVRYLGRHDG